MHCLGLFAVHLLFRATSHRFLQPCQGHKSEVSKGKRVTIPPRCIQLASHLCWEGLWKCGCNSPGFPTLTAKQQICYSSHLLGVFQHHKNVWIDSADIHWLDLTGLHRVFLRQRTKLSRDRGWLSCQLPSVHEYLSNQVTSVRFDEYL